MSTEIKDENFEKKLIELGIDTNGLNGTISTLDAQKYFDLDLQNSNITDLSGIEAFVNITSLNISYNLISGVIDLSSNKNLAFLYCQNNQITKI